MAGLFERAPARAKRRVHPWPRPLRGLIVPASPPSRGPGRAGAHRARQKQQQQQSAASLQLTGPPPLRAGEGWGGGFASARWERAALPGAPMARRVGGGKSSGWLAGMRASFSPGQESRRKAPPPTRAPGRQDAWRARHRGAPLFGYFLSGTREKVTRAPVGGRNRSVVSGRRHALAIPQKMGRPQAPHHSSRVSSAAPNHPATP